MMAGDRARALEEVDAALALDPEFLAARSLRQQILAAQPIYQADASAARARHAAGATAPALAHEPAADVIASRTAAAMAAPAADAPRPAAGDGYMRFEERARRRRVDHRIDAARAAIARGKLREATSALDEVRELDPNLPELAALAAACQALGASARRSHRGPWLAAAAAFAALVLGASLIEESGGLQPRRLAAVAPLVEPATPPALTSDVAADAPTAIATSGSAAADEPIEPPPPPSAASGAETASLSPSTTSLSRAPAAPPAPVREAATPPPAARVDLSAPPIAPPVQLGKRLPVVPVPSPPAPQDAATSVPITRAVAPLRAAPEPPSPSIEVPARFSRPAASSANPPAGSVMTAAPVANAVATVTPDELLVKQALQRYRTAYEGLDARSAQAVWPAVNQVALARAFEGLESQRLTFESCSLQLAGDHAMATCRGTARYVPKIGSREPRIEPRVWSFALRKIGAEWKIDSARAER